MISSRKTILTILFPALLVFSCKKNDPVITQPVSLVRIDNAVFDPKTSANLKTHVLNIDTLNFIPYTLQGFGVFSGKSRNVDFSAGGISQGIPVVEVSGLDDFGYTYIAKDTSGNTWELYRRKFVSSSTASPRPITTFATSKLTAGDSWDSFSGWEQGMNTLYLVFKTKVLNTNSTTSNGIAGCIKLEYSSPDFADTVFFKPGKGPVEVLSWRAHLHDNNQPGFGGYR